MDCEEGIIGQGPRYGGGLPMRAPGPVRGMDDLTLSGSLSYSPQGVYSTLTGTNASGKVVWVTTIFVPR
jgi:hypothetical protein